METKGVNQIFWILLHSNGFPKACNRKQTSNILGLFFLFFFGTEISKQLGLLECVFRLKFQNVSMQRKQFPDNIMWDLGLSTSGFCCWEPDALPMQMPLNLCYKVLFTTIKTQNFYPSKFHSRDCVIAWLLKDYALSALKDMFFICSAKEH